MPEPESPAMVVDHLNTYVEGGAAVAAIRIHQSLLAAGVDSRFWYSRKLKTPPPPHSRQIAWRGENEGFVARLAGQIAAAGRKQFWRWQRKRSFSGVGKSSEIFTTPYHDGPTPFPPAQLCGDVLHLHWVSNMLDYQSFFAALPSDKPVIWTLHDMNPLTGGCHFSGDCKSFETECGRCPLLARPSGDDLASRSFQLKWNALRGRPLHVVAPSRWLAEQARRSRLLASAASIRVIPYGLDVTRLAPVDKHEARIQLGLPPDRFVLACGAALMTQHRKGFRQLMEALGRLQNKPGVLAVVFGRGELPRCDWELPEIRSVGYVSDLAKQALVYSAADLFVLPSLDDNLPQTGLEALACGTPVVGFETGGIPDFVLPGQTGLLARRGDAADLAEKIEWLRQHPDELASMRTNARRLIADQFCAAREAEQYSDLYRELLETHAAGGKHAA